MGTRIGRCRLPDLLLLRLPERKTRYNIKAFRVSPGEGGGGKPDDINGFTGNPPSGAKSIGLIVYLLISPTPLTPSKEME